MHLLKESGSTMIFFPFIFKLANVTHFEYRENILHSLLVLLLVFKNLLKISIGNFQGNFSGLWMNTISFFNILNVIGKICWLFASLSHIISIYNLLNIFIARHLASYFVELFQLLNPHNNSNKKTLLALFYRKEKKDPE